MSVRRLSRNTNLTSHLSDVERRIRNLERRPIRTKLNARIVTSAAIAPAAVTPLQVSFPTTTVVPLDSTLADTIAAQVDPTPGDVVIDTSVGQQYVYDQPTNSWPASVDIASIAAAATAQTTADGKNTVFTSGTTPTAKAVGDAWINTASGNSLSTWNGTSWVSVVDTTIAAAAVAAAAAQTTANGKNKIYRQGTTPTGTLAAGDVWFNTSSDNAISRYDGSTWVATSLGNGAIASLSASKLTAGTIDASVITVSNLDAGSISTGTLAAARIAAGSLNASVITAGTITASQIAGGTITATQINSGYVYAGTISANNITAGTIASVTLTSANGTFSGNLSAAGGTFTGALSAATGTFAGSLSAAGGTFTGALSAATGTFAGSLSAATGTFSGNISAATGTFSGNISATGGSVGGWTISSTRLYASGSTYLESSTGNIATLGTLVVQGIITGNSAINGNSTMSCNGLLTVSSGGISVTGTATFSGTLKNPGITAGTYQTVTYNTGNNSFYYISSSERYKDNISPIVPMDYLSAILKLQPVSYTYKSEFSDSPTRVEHGLIAERVFEIPELKPIVILDGGGVPESVIYDRLAVFMIPAIKQLNDKITRLEGLAGVTH